jgi:hypothetical protein
MDCSGWAVVATQTWNVTLDASQTHGGDGDDACDLRDGNSSRTRYVQFFN